MTRTAAAWITIALLATSSGIRTAAATDTASAKPVVELFTSQGCSSCPPADKLLARLARRDDIIALSYNVDYWDYLGWKDTLASRANTKRQYAYAHARGDNKVYTPQAVVNGLRHVVGSRPEKIETALSATRKPRLSNQVSLAVTATGSGLTIALDGKVPSSAKAATITIAAVQPAVKVKIKRGENHGRQITYHNVVRKFMSIGQWTGGPKRITVDRRKVAEKPGQRCVVLIQAKGPGAVLAAAWAPDPN